MAAAVLVMVLIRAVVVKQEGGSDGQHARLQTTDSSPHLCLYNQGKTFGLS